MRKTFKYRIYPTKPHMAVLESTLSSCQELYNAALQERRDAWQLNQLSNSVEMSSSKSGALSAAAVAVGGMIEVASTVIIDKGSGSAP